MSAQHLIVPFAMALPEAAHAALRELVLPHTSALLSCLTETSRDDADELSLSPPHERAVAHALGLAGGDGLLPLAAVAAARDVVDAGAEGGQRPWGWLTPAHWRLGTEQIGMTDPDALHLDEAASRALLEAVRDLFESEGFELHYAAPTRWYASHAVLEGLPSASLDRVIGRNVDRWLAADPRARLVRRLQNEVQMLLYTHPINDAREARGELAVNSFWLSGCGVAPSFQWSDGLLVDPRLRSPALNEDWFAWSKAWHTLDGGPLAELLARARRGMTSTLTLCGERAAVEYRLQPRGPLQRLRSKLKPRSDVATLLETL